MPNEGRTTPDGRAKIVRLYEHASPELHRLLVRKLGNDDEAREVAQHTFEKLLAQVEREDIRDVRRLCFAVANRLAIDALRRRQVRERYLREHANEEDGAEQDPHERALIGREQLLAVREALNALPAKTRHVFLLHRFHSYTYEEIAAQIGLSRRSVEYQISLALNAISEALDPLREE